MQDSLKGTQVSLKKQRLSTARDGRATRRADKPRSSRHLDDTANSATARRCQQPLCRSDRRRMEPQTYREWNRKPCPRPPAKPMNWDERTCHD